MCVSSHAVETLVYMMISTDFPMQFFSNIYLALIFTAGDAGIIPPYAEKNPNNVNMVEKKSTTLKQKQK